jgi:hypothetical protein
LIRQGKFERSYGLKQKRLRGMDIPLIYAALAGELSAKGF